MKNAVIIAIFFFTSSLFIETFVHAESLAPESGRTNIVDVHDTNAAAVETDSREQKTEDAVAKSNNVEVTPVEDNLSLLFIGDIMGHDSQIRSARQPGSETYDYSSCFEYIRSYISAADLAIANLEVTLAGPPYTGYPTFSSPDTLALACKDAGIDVLVTANNHCVDRGKQGLEQTISTLESLNIPHTGTFLSYSDKQKKSPLIIEKNNFKIALINYTAETNEIPVPEPSFVNIIKINRLKEDISKAKLTNPDVIILFFHWGTEKQYEPSEDQLALAEICFDAGADIIIGSHPHVLQKSILENRSGRNKLVAYSLGNFIANQKAPKTDGGQMIQLTLSKKNGITTVSKAEYILTWIYGPKIEEKKNFYILPCKDFENRPEFFAAPEYYNKMKSFIIESRKLLNNRNKNVREIK